LFALLSSFSSFILSPRRYTQLFCCADHHCLFCAAGITRDAPTARSHPVVVGVTCQTCPPTCPIPPCPHTPPACPHPLVTPPHTAIHTAPTAAVHAGGPHPPVTTPAALHLPFPSLPTLPLLHPLDYYLPTFPCLWEVGTHLLCHYAPPLHWGYPTAPPHLPPATTLQRTPPPCYPPQADHWALPPSPPQHALTASRHGGRGRLPHPS